MKVYLANLLIRDPGMGASLFYRLFNKQDINLRSALVIGTQVTATSSKSNVALAFMHGWRYRYETASRLYQRGVSAIEASF